MTFSAAVPSPHPEEPGVPPGTPAHTRWGWLTAYVMVASVVLTIGQLWIASVAMLAYFEQLGMVFLAQQDDPGALDSTLFNGMARTLSPLLIGSMLSGVLSWGLYALGVVAAYFDYRELGRLGYPRRFHWAWNFLSPAYPIGRAVVVHRQVGAGWATMWISIASCAAILLITAIWTVWLFIATFDTLAALSGTMA